MFAILSFINSLTFSKYGEVDSLLFMEKFYPSQKFDHHALR